MSNREAVLSVLRWASGGVAATASELEAALDDLPARLLPLVAHVALRDGLGSGFQCADRLERSLRDAHVAWAVRSRVVRELAGGLSRHGIEAIFLKGVALAAQVYPHPALRPMADVDAWVRVEQLDGVVQALESCGFQVPARHRRVFPDHGDVPTVALEPVSGSPVYFEIHGLPNSLSRLPESGLDSMWRQRRTLAGSGISVLHPDDQLLHLCLHLSRKYPFQDGLPPLVDVSLMVRRMDPLIEWPRFEARVNDMRAAASVWSVLRLARDLLDARVPDSVLAALAVPDSDSLLVAAKEQLWSSQPRLTTALEHVFGGGARRGWFRNRIVGRHWRAAGRSFEPLPGRVVATARLVTRDLWVQAGRYASRLCRGEFVRAAFWRSAFGARRRGRLRRMLERGDREAARHG